MGWRTERERERERGFYEETQLFYNDVLVVVDDTGLATTRVILPIRTKKTLVSCFRIWQREGELNAWRRWHLTARRGRAHYGHGDWRTPRAFPAC